MFTDYDIAQRQSRATSACVALKVTRHGNWHAILGLHPSPGEHDVQGASCSHPFLGGCSLGYTTESQAHTS